MAVIATLAASITARTHKFDRGMKRARRSLLRFTRFAVGAAGIASVGAAFVKIATSTEMFSRAMRQSQAIMGRLSERIKRTMTDTAISVARVTRFSASEAAKAYFFLASAGLSAMQSIKALPVVAKFAQAGNFGMALATDLLTDAQSALGLSVADSTQNMKNMIRVGNALVAANTAANASVQLLSEALTNKAAAALKFLNKDIEEGLAVLAAFADQGTKGAEAGTALDIVFRELARRARENKAAFRRMNIEVFRGGEMRKLADIIEDFEIAFADLTPEMKGATLAMLGFQEKSSAFLKRLLGASKAIRAYESHIRSAGNVMDEVSSKQLTPFQKNWARLTAAITEAGLALKPIIDGFAKLLGFAASVIEKLTALFNNMVVGFRMGTRFLAERFSRTAERLFGGPATLSPATQSVATTVVAPDNTAPMVNELKRINTTLERSASLD